MRAQDWPWYLGGALAVGALGLIITRRDPLGVGKPVAPIGPPPPRPVDAPGAPLRWIELEPPYRLFAGDVYRGTVDIPFGAGVLVTRSAITSRGGEMGFADIVVLEDEDELPADWPGDRKGDRFVQATWTKEDRIVAGDKHLLRAWRRTRA